MISPEYLYEKLNSGVKVPDIIIFDTSYYLPHENRNPNEEYYEIRLPNTFRYDIDQIADRTNNLPHMLPSIEHFENSLRKFGINENTMIVFYDSNDRYLASARAWWTFRFFGIDNVYILEGGLSRWIKMNYPTEKGKDITFPTPSKFYVTKIRREILSTINDILENIESKSAQLIDTRPNGRFKGIVPEPREGLHSGHIPGSINIEYLSLLKDGSFKSNSEIEDMLKDANIDSKKPIIVSCGSGVSASVLAFALHRLNMKYSVYDGSWSEYGKIEHNYPISKN